MEFSISEVISLYAACFALGMAICNWIRKR